MRRPRAHARVPPENREPKRKRSGAIDHRADLYSLGVVAYELIAGVHPFGSRSPQALLKAHLDEAPVPLGEIHRDLPRTLVAIVMSCLANAATARPASAQVVLAALDTAFREHDTPRRRRFNFTERFRGF